MPGSFPSRRGEDLSGKRSGGALPVDLRMGLSLLETVPVGSLEELLKGCGGTVREKEPGWFPPPESGRMDARVRNRRQVGSLPVWSESSGGRIRDPTRAGARMQEKRPAGRAGFRPHGTDHGPFVGWDSRRELGAAGRFPVPESTIGSGSSGGPGQGRPAGGPGRARPEVEEEMNQGERERGLHES